MPRSSSWATSRDFGPRSSRKSSRPGARGDRPIVVPRYAGSGALNPVLLDRSVWPLAMALEGDRGMGPLIKSSPDLVLDVPVSGDNPDVDTPADLAGLTADR